MGPFQTGERTLSREWEWGTAVGGGGRPRNGVVVKRPLECPWVITGQILPSVDPEPQNVPARRGLSSQLLLRTDYGLGPVLAALQTVSYLVFLIPP